MNGEADACVPITDNQVRESIIARVVDGRDSGALIFNFLLSFSASLAFFASSSGGLPP